MNWPGITITIVALALGAFLLWWQERDRDDTPNIEEALQRIEPYDVTADNWLEASHYLAWIDTLPETLEHVEDVA